MQNSSFDWKYHTESSPFFGDGLRNGKMAWPRGKMLGGSSALNAMLYVRGNDKDFNDWSLDSWSWHDVLPFFKKSERNLSPEKLDAKYHGFDGLMNIENYSSFPVDEQMKQLISDCFSELGFPKLEDLNGDKYIGFGRAQGNLNRGHRQSTASAFLNPKLIGERKNLHIVKLAHVTRVTFDERTNAVDSVEFVRTDRSIKMTAKVRKEVILSAGTINTPQILMVSGIGQSKMLKKFGIKIVKDASGVGQNLQDHLIVPFFLSFHKSTAKSPSILDLPNDYFEFLTKQNGIFSNLGSTDFMGFVNTLNDSNYPDVQFLNFMFVKQSTAVLSHLLNLFNYKQEISHSILTANNEADILIIFTVLLNPKSVGSIELNDGNPFAAPKIQPNYLQNDADIATILRAIKILHRLPSTKTFNRHEGEIVNIDLPTCDKLNKTTDKYWQCYIHQMALTLYHPVGTAKMGSDDDASAVVDSKLCVRGVRGLRVADASIMPQIVSANTNAATIMIGERAADFIVKFHQPQTNENHFKDEF